MKQRSDVTAVNMEIKRVFVTLMQVCISGLLACIHQVASQVCPDYWQRFDSIDNKVTCLWLSNEKATWLDAMSWCRLMDGQLVELQTQAFNNALAKMITLKTTGKYWIGLTRVENERVFKWMTSKKIAYPMTSFFKPGQQLSGQGKYCVNTDEKGEWAVESCDAKFWFICQKNSHIKGSARSPGP